VNAVAPTAVITLFVDSRATRGADAGCYTNDPGVAGREWRSELREHAGLRLALRVDERNTTEDGERIDGSVVALPHYVGVGAMIRRLPALVAAVDAAVKDSDVVAVKLPGVIGLVAVAHAKRRKKPIAVQLVGDIAEVLRAGVAGKTGVAIAPVAASATRRAVRRGAVVRYVTERVLQERYPSRRGAVAVAYSDVRVDFRTGELSTAVPGRVIAVGSQEQLYKGHQTLIEAIAALAPADPRIHLELIGDGRCQPQLRALANARGIGDRVLFAGHVGDRAHLLELLDRADVFAMPSLTEGMPRALIEAMARGLPCVGSDVGGIPELLPASAMVHPGDVDALARLLRRALDEPAFRAQLLAAGAVTAARFRPEELESRRQEWSHAIAALTSRTGTAT
jgi:hypothetical protein